MPHEAPETIPDGHIPPVSTGTIITPGADLGGPTVTVIAESRIREIVREEFAQIGKRVSASLPFKGSFAQGGIVPTAPLPSEAWVDAVPGTTPLDTSPTVGRYFSAARGHEIVEGAGDKAYSICMSYGLAAAVANHIREHVQAYLCEALGLATPAPSLNDKIAAAARSEPVAHHPV